MNERRGSWYLLTGLFIGLALGLAYAWVVSPVRYVDTSPASMREDYKDQYRTLIAAAYAASGDLARARARLSLLQEPDEYRTLAAQAQQKLAQGGASDEARVLGALAAALAENPPPGETPAPMGDGTQGEPQEQGSPEPATPILSPEGSTEIASSVVFTSTVGATRTMTPEPLASSTPTPDPTRTQLPTLTPAATQGALFVLAERDLVCDPQLTEPLLQVEITDAAGEPVPGVELVVSWPGQEESIFTGLKSELGLGYADFVMTPGEIYGLRFAGGGEEVEDLTPEQCQEADGELYWGSWLLTFTLPGAQE